MNEETVYKIWVIDSISLGDGSIPQNPTAGGNCFPQTPAIKCIEALFNFLVYNTVSKPIGRKDGLCEANFISFDLHLLIPGPLE